VGDDKYSGSFYFAALDSFNSDAERTFSDVAGKNMASIFIFLSV